MNNAYSVTEVKGFKKTSEIDVFSDVNLRFQKILAADRGAK